MSKLKYHISPYTTQPMICRAKDESSCPYKKNNPFIVHYSSYEEALKACDEELQSKFAFVSRAKMTSTSDEDRVRANELIHQEKLITSRESGLDPKTVIENMSADNMLLQMFDRSAKTSGSWENLEALFKNPNLTREIIDRVTSAPNDYNEEVQIAITKSPSLTERDVGLIVAFTDSEEVQYRVLKEIDWIEPNFNKYIEGPVHEFFVEELRTTRKNGKTTFRGLLDNEKFKRHEELYEKIKSFNHTVIQIAESTTEEDDLKYRK